MMPRNIRWVALALLTVSSVAMAVKPVEVKHSSEDDFAAGEATDVTIWSTGEVTVGRATETVLEQSDEVAMISSLTSDKEGNLYIGTAPKARVLKIDLDGNTTTLADLDGVLVSALKLDGSNLYAATAGGKCGLFSINLAEKAQTQPAVKPLWQAPENTSIWAFVKDGDTFYIATGGEGKIYAVSGDGKAEAIFTSQQEIVQSLIAVNGKLIAGTGEEGLVYAINPKAKTSRVLLDAAEQEISALAADAAGNIYVAATNGSQEAAEPNAAPAPSTRMMVQPQPQKPGDGGGPGGDSADSEGDAPAQKAAPDADVTTAAKGAKGTTQPSRPPVAARSLKPSAGPKGAGAEQETGNTIYRINKDGFVQPVVRLDQPILDMILAGSPDQPRLLVSTGDGGRIYEVNPAKREYAVLASVDAKQVTKLALESTGMVVAGTANPATAFELDSQVAEQGTLLSKPIDAQQIARWGQIRVDGRMPSNAEVTVATRTGNVEEPAEDTWSRWSAEIPLGDTPAAITSPAGRFLQYRLTFKSAEGKAGVVKEVGVIFQVDNLPPEIKTVKVEPQETAEGGGAKGAKDQETKPMPYRKITIDASDPNEDDLTYDVFIRPLGRQMWLHVGRDITENNYVWNTRTAPDGRYDLKVEASDRADNPAATALSADKTVEVVVDNTPPVLADVTAKMGEDGQVLITGLACDAVSRIDQVEYTVDSREESSEAAPADGIYDSSQEKFTATIKHLKPGPHLITVQATDEYGNVGYQMLEVNVGK